MNRAYLCIVSCLLVVSFPVNQSVACTTFCLKHNGEVLFGRNYDFNIGDALIFANKRGVAKTASIGDSPNSAKWVSRYGSITFNQFGRENPNGGMNEMGLVVEEMWLDETEYPKDDSRPTLGTQEWIQYLLDSSATTTEALKNAAGVRIIDFVKVHYLVSDKAGNTASVEFLKGKMVVHTGDQLAVPTLTNNTYEESLSYAKQTDPEKAKSSTSLDLFTRAAHKTEEFEKRALGERQAVAYAFEVLSEVAQKNWTQWSIVYDQKRGKIYFRTLQSPAIKSIDMKAFDYSCGTGVKMFDMNAKDEGDVTAKFTNYTRKANRDLIERSFSGTDFLKDVPTQLRRYVAAYPESFTCRSQKAP
jgi:choloylglycine hydrolase